jgi:hypothetical protein
VGSNRLVAVRGAAFTSQVLSSLDGRALVSLRHTALLPQGPSMPPLNSPLGWADGSADWLRVVSWMLMDVR